VHIITPISESLSSDHQDTNVQQLHIVLDQNNESSNANGPESFDQGEHEQEIEEHQHHEEADGDTVMVIEEEVPESEEVRLPSVTIDHDANTQLIEETVHEEQEQDTHENQQEDDMELVEAEVMQ